MQRGHIRGNVEIKGFEGVRKTTKKRLKRTKLAASDFREMGKCRRTQR